MVMSKLKFGLIIKQNISVMSSVQLPDIPKIDAVEIQDIQIYIFTTHRHMHRLFNRTFSEF